jgi:release factor glutamine methyltransferase
MRLDQLLDQLMSGIPLPYLTGKQSFYGLDFSVNPHVLIPRPETEMLVDAALEYIGKRGTQLIAADVGTGSGCIAISLAKNQPGLKMLAGDISHDAVLVAKENASTHQIGQAITFWVGDLLSAVLQQFDCICANLPYIPSSRLPKLEVSKHEPISALDGGEDGFLLIERLLEQSASRLKPGGCLFLEIDHTHASRISQSAELIFPLSSITIEKDYAGLYRLAVVRMP